MTTFFFAPFSSRHHLVATAAETTTPFIQRLKENLVWHHYRKPHLIFFAVNNFTTEISETFQVNAVDTSTRSKRCTNHVHSLTERPRTHLVQFGLVVLKDSILPIPLGRQSSVSLRLSVAEPSFFNQFAVPQVDLMLLLLS